MGFLVKKWPGLLGHYSVLSSRSQNVLLTFGSRSSAGAETTATSMYWWALAMIAHPEIQKRAQAELDAVVGRFRPPTCSDAPSLPYIQAMVKETPVAPCAPTRPTAHRGSG